MTPKADALSNTHQKFRRWLGSTFTDGVPTEEEWQTILDEDKEAMCAAEYGAYGQELLYEEVVEGREDVGSGDGDGEDREDGSLKGDQVQPQGEQEQWPVACSSRGWLLSSCSTIWHLFQLFTLPNINCQ